MRRKHPTRRLYVRPAFRDMARDVFGVATDAEIAVRLDLNPGAFSRLMSRKSQPDNFVIITAIDQFSRPFDDLFEIVDEVAA